MFMSGEDLPNAGIIYRDVIIQNVTREGPGLRLRGLRSGRYRLDVFYEDVLYSQIDETSVNRLVSLVEELSFDEFFEPRHDKCRDRMLSEIPDQYQDLLDKLSRRECRLYAHYRDGRDLDERIVLASGVRVEEPDPRMARLKAEARVYPYYACISHAAGGVDEKWARRLERRLEKYRVPVEVVSRQRLEEAEREENTGNTEVIPERFNTLRLDGGSAHEGGEKTPADLARYLIVICSPRGASSALVDEDARGFVDAGREEYIIPFIIDGEPDAEGERRCYPPSLFPDLLGIALSDGTSEEAFFRIIARLLRVKFSRLYQRHLRQQRRFMVRALAAASGVLCLLLVLTIWAVLAEITAARQSEEAEGLARFLVEDIGRDERLPADVRSMIDERIRIYDRAHEKEAAVAEAGAGHVL
jgi:hypothetical protein